MGIETKCSNDVNVQILVFCWMEKGNQCNMSDGGELWSVQSSPAHVVLTSISRRSVQLFLSSLLKK